MTFSSYWSVPGKEKKNKSHKQQQKKDAFIIRLSCHGNKASKQTKGWSHCLSSVSRPAIEDMSKPGNWWGIIETVLNWGIILSALSHILSRCGKAKKRKEEKKHRRGWTMRYQDINPGEQIMFAMSQAYRDCWQLEWYIRFYMLTCIYMWVSGIFFSTQGAHLVNIM